MDTKTATIVGAIAAAGAAALFVVSSPDAPQPQPIAAPGDPSGCHAIEVLAPAALAEQAGMVPASDPDLVPLVAALPAALPGPSTPADVVLDDAACAGLAPGQWRVRPAAEAWPSCVAGDVAWEPTGAEYEQAPPPGGRCCQPGCRCASSACGPVPPAEIGSADRHRECLYQPDRKGCETPTARP